MQLCSIPSFGLLGDVDRNARIECGAKTLQQTCFALIRLVRPDIFREKDPVAGSGRNFCLHPWGATASPS